MKPQDHGSDLLAQSNFLEKINSVLPCIVYIFDLGNQSIVYSNDHIRELYGYSSEDFQKMGTTFLDSVIHPEDAEKFRNLLPHLSTLKEGEIQEVTYRIKDRHQQYHWVAAKLTIFSRSAEGKPQTLLGVATEINDRKKYEETLKNTIEKMNLSLSAANMGTWEWDSTNQIMSWDQRMYEMHDVSPGPNVVVVDELKKILEPSSFEEPYQITKTALKEKKDFNMVYQIRRKKDGVRHIKCYGKYLIDDDKPRIYGVSWDATDEILATEQLAEAQAKMITSTKMAALGEMSGGIAHEINNPLTVIQARSFQLSQMIEQNSLDIETVRQAAESINRTSDKIARIVRSLRSFSRDGAQDPFDIVSMQKIVEETLDFCRTRLSNYGVEVQVLPFSEHLDLECRYVQIEQVLLNLLNNSFDAIQGLDERWIRVEVTENNGFIEIKVVDSGKGIPSNIKDKVMMPFFSTKGVGKGTGLGLSISSGIMKSHKGQLYIDDNASNTTFVARLPQFQEKSGEEK